MIDLASLALTSEPVAMKVCHPVTGVVVTHDDGRPFTITLHGKDSETLRLARNKIIDRRSARFKPTMAAAESDVIEMMVAATQSWDFVLDGKIPDCKPGLVAKVYLEQPWLLDQVGAFVEDRSNYMKSKVEG